MKKFPEKHLQHFIVCNSNAFYFKQDFYKLKDKILAKYGTPDGYDLQTITKKCYKCHGTGKWNYWNDEEDMYDDDSCRECHNGIYWQSKYKLNRYFLNGRMFHIPESVDWRFEGEESKNRIDSRIIHQNIEGDAYNSYLYLLFQYDKKKFVEHWKNWGKDYLKSWKGDIKRWIRSFIPQRSKQYSIEEFDDVPF